MSVLPIEFSQKFDILFNNLMSNAAPEIDEFEKSVILTKAQREIIKNFLRKGGNKYREGIDDSKERFWNFSTLIEEISTPTLVDPLNEENVTISKWCIAKDTISNAANNTTYDSMMGILNERIDCYVHVLGTQNFKKTQTIVVRPISYEEYDRLQQKPFRYPKRGTAWSLQSNESDPAIYIILNPADEADKINYRVRGVLNPSPIITVNLHTEFNDNSLFIDGEYEASVGSLSESMYDEVIQRAVELAKASYSSDQSGQAQMQNQITIGQRSE